MLSPELMKILEDSGYLVQLDGCEGSLVATFPERVLPPQTRESKYVIRVLTTG